MRVMLGGARGLSPELHALRHRASRCSCRIFMYWFSSEQMVQPAEQYVLVLFNLRLHVLRNFQVRTRCEDAPDCVSAVDEPFHCLDAIGIVCGLVDDLEGFLD